MSEPIVDGLARRLGRRQIVGAAMAGALGLAPAAGLAGHRHRRRTCTRGCKERHIRTCLGWQESILCPGCEAGASAYCNSCYAHVASLYATCCYKHGTEGAKKVARCMCALGPDGCVGISLAAERAGAGFEG